MQRLRTICTLTLITPALAILMLGAGCGKSDPTPAGGGPGAQSTENQTPTVAAKAIIVKEDATGTIKGRVTFDGEAPKLPLLSEREDFKKTDFDHCSKGPVADQTWVIGPDNGVANVFVWVKPPGRDYFVVPESQRKNTKQIELNQPFCAFEPHAQVLFPSYRDDKNKLHPTGQILVVKNSAPVNHNTNIKGSGLANPEWNKLIQGKKGDTVNQLEVTLNPDIQPITVKCDLHKWMTAYFWAFDHPYAAITDQNGNYTIPNVPAGSEIYLVAWHEGGGYVGAKGNQGKPVKLEPGQTLEENFTLKAK